MRWFLLIATLLLPLEAVAHPADDLITHSEWFAGISGQPINMHACSKDPLLHSMFKAHWHHRRDAEQRIGDYRECIGSWKKTHGYRPQTDVGLEKYWEVIPATPMVNDCELFFRCKDDNCRNWVMTRLEESAYSALLLYIRADDNTKACEAGL